MFIDWLEIRNKETGFMLKHSDFSRVNLIAADDKENCALAFQWLRNLAKLAVGESRRHFLNNICRVQVQTDMGALLWYCKTDPGQTLLWQAGNQLRQAPLAVLDEEELYTEDGTLLFSRNQKGADCFATKQFIPLNPSSSTPSALGLPECQALFKAFQRFYVFPLSQDHKEAVRIALEALPPESCVLLNALTETTSVDVTDLLATCHPSVQVIAFNTHAEGIPQKELVKKRNGMALQDQV